MSDVQTPTPGELPCVAIEGDGDLPKVCDEIEHLLIQAGAQIYQRGGALVRVINEPSARKGILRDPAAPRIVPFDDLALCELVSRFIEVRRRNRKTQELVRVDCPRVVAQTILARREWRFQVLEAVIEHPVLLSDGQVLWESSFHESSGLLLRLPFSEFQAPYEEPSREDAEGALVELRRLLEGFDFVGGVDESVALAYLLTPFVRPVIPTAPAFAFDAHAAGSGKSTLVRAGAAVSTGRDPAFLTFGDDPAEMKKLLFAALLEGDQQIAIDNVDVPVSGSELAVILTSPMYRGRVLGQSINASVPTKSVITLNGNNLQIVGDLTRRILVCRLDPTCERPAEREFEFDPVVEARQMRSHYVLAALTIMQAYLCSGERVKVRPFGSFNAWSRFVRESLVWLGLDDPVESIRVLEDADPERTQLRSMLQAVNAARGSSQFKVADLILVASSKSPHNQAQLMAEPDISEAIREALQEALQAVCERNGELNARALGRWLLRMKGRIEGGLRFVQVRQTSSSSIWQVESVA